MLSENQAVEICVNWKQMDIDISGPEFCIVSKGLSCIVKVFLENLSIRSASKKVSILIEVI